MITFSVVGIVTAHFWGGWMVAIGLILTLICLTMILFDSGDHKILYSMGLMYGASCVIPFFVGTLFGSKYLGHFLVWMGTFLS